MKKHLEKKLMSVNWSVCVCVCVHVYACNHKLNGKDTF